MGEAERVRRQIRVVLVVHRTERERIVAMAARGEARQEDLDGLRARSIEILDTARAQLDGSAAWHPQLLEELAQARMEVSRID
ncbi:MAG: hypothetical protein M3P14_05445 [Chloroflexota bacterium]|nr:hypothetical protein [Chloroflexota bacterium]